MFVGIGETNYQGWIRMVATQITDIPFMLSFLANFKKMGAAYWRHVNTILLEHMKYNIQF